MEPVGNTEALQLLQDLDRRQDRVMEELNELNSRIEKVLELYLQSRNTAVGLPSSGQPGNNAKAA